MPGQEAGGSAADGGTGTVVGDRPLSGTVQEREYVLIHHFEWGKKSQSS